MKFAILSDIHFGPEGYYNGVLRKINKDVRTFLNNFIEDMNNNIKPDFVVVLGDIIEDENHDNDLKNAETVMSMLERLTSPVYYVAGNHDLKSLTEKELCDLFGRKELYYSFDTGELHSIVLFSKVVEYGNVEISPEQVTWLEQDLKKCKGKCIMFVHHGLSEQDLTGNPWFDGRPERCLIRNRGEVRKIIEKSGKVLAVFNSHLHWNKMDVHNKIHYYTLQSLVENEGDKGIASEAWAVVNIDRGKVSVEVKGNYSIKF